MRDIITGRDPDAEQHTFSLYDRRIPVQSFGDGSSILASNQVQDTKHWLQFGARMADDVVAAPASIEVTFDNGPSSR